MDRTGRHRHPRNPAALCLEQDTGPGSDGLAASRVTSRLSDRLEEPEKHDLMANDSGRSDNLQDLVGLVEDSKSPLVRLLSEVVSIKIIIDANVAYKAIRWIAVKRKNPAAKPEILELIETGYVEIHAPKFIDDEIQEHLHEIVEKSGKTSEQIQQLWSDLKSNIHLHDTSSLPELPTEVAEVDPDDVPYIQLHQKLNHQIVSDDKHISKMGGRGTDLTVISRLKDLYRANATEYQFAISGYGIMVLGSHVIPGLLSMLKNAVNLRVKCTSNLRVKVHHFEDVEHHQNGTAGSHKIIKGSGMERSPDIS